MSKMQELYASRAARLDNVMASAQLSGLAPSPYLAGLLCQYRAQSVASYLIAQGVDGSRLSTRGAGPDQPIASNATPDGRAQNRRVEVTLRPLPGAQQQAPQSGQYQQY